MVLNHPDRREDGRHSKANCTSSGFEPHSTGWEGSIWGIPAEKPVRPKIKIPQPPSQKAFGTDPVVEVAWSPDTLWGIQVGALERYTAAQQQIDVAARAQPNHLENKRVLIIPAEGDSGGLYRARVAGFKEDEALAVCALLVRKNIDCVPVPPQRLDEDPWILQ